MALIHINGTGQVTWLFTGGGMQGNAAITLGIQTSNTDVQEVAEACNAAIFTTIKPRISLQLQLIAVKVALRLSGNTEVAESFTGLPSAGGGSGGMLPASCAVLIQKRTAFAGRANRGRFYVPGIPISNITTTSDANTLESSELGNWQTLADTFFDNLVSPSVGDSIQPVILHPEPVSTVTEVTAFAVSARLATQRGRLRD